MNLEVYKFRRTQKPIYIRITCEHQKTKFQDSNQRAASESFLVYYQIKIHAQKKKKDLCTKHLVGPTSHKTTNRRLGTSPVFRVILNLQSRSILKYLSH